MLLAFTSTLSQRERGLFGGRREPLLAGARTKGVNDAIEPAVQNGVEVVQGEADTMVGHAILREVVGPDLLATVTRADLAAAGLAALDRLALPLRVEKPCAQNRQRLDAVLELRFLILNADDGVRGADA